MTNPRRILEFLLERGGEASTGRLEEGRDWLDG